jgi:flagellar hook-basal body complex protein FliE
MTGITANAVAGAYATAQRLASPVSEMMPNESAKEGGGFADLVKQAVGSVAETGRVADGQTFEAAVGKSDMVDVVTAVAESEAALETLVAVRDRVIAAYEEIMRMPI